MGRFGVGRRTTARITASRGEVVTRWIVVGYCSRSNNMSPTLRLIAAVSILAGCGLLDSSGDSSPLSFSIMGGSYFDPPEAHHIALIVQTKTQYPCMNYQLESSLGVA